MHLKLDFNQPNQVSSGEKPQTLQLTFNDLSAFKDVNNKTVEPGLVVRKDLPR